MKKNLLRRSIFGAPTGLMIFVWISLLFAHLKGDGEFHVGYYLIRVYGSEVSAVTALVLSAMAMGMLWSAASLIFETDWNLLMQTVVHALCCVTPSLAIAWAMYWIPRTKDGLLQYGAIFGVIYVLVWLIHYLGMKRRIRLLTAALNRGK